MIKVTMVCTNCKKEKDIPRDKLEEAIRDDKAGELNLCVECKVIWNEILSDNRKDRDVEFHLLQRKFGIIK